MPRILVIADDTARDEGRTVPVIAMSGGRDTLASRST
jgi:hypothetical protein